MSQKFVHSTVFELKELANKKFKEGDRVYGEPFVLVCNGSYLEFRLALYLKGTVDSNSGNRCEGVLIGLKSANKGKKLKVSFKTSLQKADRSVFLLHDWWMEETFDDIFTRYCAAPIASSLVDPKLQDFLLRDGSSLRVAVEIHIDEENFDDEKELEKETLGLQFENIRLFQESYEELRKGKSDDTDYTIVCKGNKKRFSCHKFVLRKRSPYFKNLFTSHPAFGQQDVHQVEWSPEATEEVLYFIYNDKASEKFDTVPVEDLVELAEMLEMKKLLLICEKSLLAKIGRSNTYAWDHLSTAKTHNMEFLKKKALCILTEDNNLAEKLVDEGKKKDLRKEVAEFALKRGRANVLL